MTRSRLCSTAAVLAAGAAISAGTAAGFAAVPIGAARTVARTTVPVAVVIRPEAIHVGGAFSAPVSTAVCEKKVHIACYGRGTGTPGLRPLAALPSRGSPVPARRSSSSTLWLARRSSRPRLSSTPPTTCPAPPSFTVIQPAGAVAPPMCANNNRDGWAGETTLDVEYAHALAPGANILLVETPTSENEGTNGFPQIVKAEEYVIDNHLGDVISQSFSATEQTFPDRTVAFDLRSAYIDAAEPANNVTVLAAAGDSRRGRRRVRPDDLLRLPGHLLARQRPARHRHRGNPAAPRRRRPPHRSRQRVERHL